MKRLLSGWEWLFVLPLGACAAWAYCRDAVFVFLGDAVFFVDADCYARMTRARMLLAEGFRSLSHHAFENYPDGIAPNTTAPLDALIVLLARLLAWFSSDPLPLAGALVSPLLGLATLLLLAWWGISAARPLRWTMLLAFVFSPSLAQAFALGRPDHQSLIFALCAAAALGEVTLWTVGGKLAAILGGLAAGFALWTSLYEPLVLLGLAVVLRAIFLRKAMLRGDWPFWWLAAVAVFLWGVAFDGLRIHGFEGDVARYSPLWSAQIGEMQHQMPWVLFGDCGWLLLPVPLLLIWRARQRERLPAAAIALIVLGLLACLQARWTPFLALGFALCLPSALRAVPSRFAAWALFLISLWPVATAWDRMLYPEGEQARAAAENHKESWLLREAALRLRGADGGILAPWWISPAFVYWSGLPAVAGSSHYSIPGTLDTSRFYLAENDAEAQEILARRKVRWVVAYDPPRILQTAVPLLQKSPAGITMAERIWSRPSSKPAFLRPVYANEFFRIYEVASAR